MNNRIRTPSLIGQRFIIVILALLLLSGCKTELPWKIKDIYNIEVYTGNDVTLSIVDESLTNLGCTYLLTNNRNSKIYFSEVFYLQIWRNQKWNKIDVDTSFPANITVLPETQTADNTISWESIYGELPIGRYRLLVPFQSNDDPYTPKKYVVVEFNV